MMTILGMRLVMMITGYVCVWTRILLQTGIGIFHLFLSIFFFIAFIITTKESMIVFVVVFVVVVVVVLILIVVIFVYTSTETIKEEWFLKYCSNPGQSSK